MAPPPRRAETAGEETGAAGREAGLFPLILTGMHRSGTSFLGRFLVASGIDMGDALLGPHPSNPHGHFEDMSFLNFHIDILRRENSGEDQWVFKKPGIRDADRALAAALLQARIQKGCPWGWKEPRTCLFLDFWSALLPAAHFLFVFRHPSFVLDSLARRHAIPPDDKRSNARFLKTWLSYNRELLQFARRHRERSVLVALHRVTADPAGFVSLLRARLRCRSFSEDILKECFDKSILNELPPVPRRVDPMLQIRAGLLFRRLMRASML
jgi:hypothetical protein